MASDPVHDRLLAITLRLPGAYEDRPWGSVHCKVDEKIFVGWGRLDDGDMSVGFRVDPAFQTMLVAHDPRFTVARYVGKHGGVDMRLGPRPDWREVEAFIVGSYRLIAKKRRIAELDALGEEQRGEQPTPKAKAKAKTKAGAKPARAPAPKKVGAAKKRAR